ncbi:MAG TPA: hypothetical protein VFW44_00820 [Bryobacteraceae bacterium]|nr:hypothetical protein [Bryobacteraceae bacterium]
MFTRTRIVFAAAYLLFVVFVFVGLKYADPGWAEGGIPLVIVGLPWSIPALLIEAGISLVPGIDKITVTEGANFFTFVILCGGLNAALILGPVNVLRLLRARVQIRVVAAISAVLLVAIVQVIGPKLDRDALERSRPQNVPKDAVHVGPAIGWWQHCTYDSERNVNNCYIWNRGGLILAEGEFVAYDGGGPAKTDELLISDAESGPDRVSLQNGRILIPKAREAEMKRFVDWLKGKRQTP